MAPLAVLPLWDAQSLGAALSAAILIKQFVVSQVVKIAFLQPADSHLLAPQETVTAILVATLALTLTALVVARMVDRVRAPIIGDADDPHLLALLGFWSIAIALTAIFVRDAILSARLFDIDEDELRRGLAVWNYLGGLLPCRWAH